MQTIYEPKGRALEYAPLALNIYTDCPHCCRSCFVKKMPWYKPRPVEVRKGLLAALEKQAKKMAEDAREVLLCFTCDPYPRTGDTSPTRDVIEILDRHQMVVTVLTKVVTHACRDFDILKGNRWRFGTTITGLHSDKMEPGAATVINRVLAIEAAHAVKIQTWVSVEPVYDPDDALAAIEKLLPIVDSWKVGKLNHEPEEEKKIDWKKFYADAQKLLKGRRVYWKKDLVEAALR